MSQLLGNISVLIEAPVFNLALLIDGLLIGGVFALAAYGLALVWGVMNVKNLAQGDFVMETNDLRKKALASIEATRFVPSAGRKRLYSMIEQRPDWCVSRQRAWGVPLPIFVHKETNEPLRDQAVIDRVATAFEEEGGDAWFSRDPQEFLGNEYKAEDFEQVTDVVEVWFDSGSTHSYVLEARPDLKWPADLYLEGSDQHRGWFHTSLLESVGTRGRAPFDAVLTHEGATRCAGGGTSTSAAAGSRRIGRGVRRAPVDPHGRTRRTGAGDRTLRDRRLGRAGGSGAAGGQRRAWPRRMKAASGPGLPKKAAAKKRPARMTPLMTVPPRVKVQERAAYGKSRFGRSVSWAGAAGCPIIRQPTKTTSRPSLCLTSSIAAISSEWVTAMGHAASLSTFLGSSSTSAWTLPSRWTRTTTMRAKA